MVTTPSYWLKASGQGDPALKYWTTGDIGPTAIKMEKGAPKAKGKLSQEQLGDLAKSFAKNGLAKLTSHGVPRHGSMVIEIQFGKKALTLNAGAGKASAEEDKAIRARYQEIAKAVKTLCKEPAK